MIDSPRNHVLSIEILKQEQAGELDGFLALHSHSSMYLRAELRRDGDRADFAVARRDGRIVAAAAQAASGMIVLQAPLAAGRLAAAVLGTSDRRLAGFFGPWSQVQAARHDMGLGAIPLLKDTHEDLFALELADLRVPAILAAGKVRCRVAGEADFDRLVAWRAAFRQAAMGNVEGEHLEKASRADIAALLPAGSLFILEGDGALACCSFNARLPDVVQIGNVWTPPELRGQGYARAVVAGALATARQTGVAAATLSTGRQNAAAQAAYRSLGFRLVGDYAIATLSPDAALPAIEKLFPPAPT
jgi:ribosomal protein S18 acetylase RimI-like enzyme